MTNEDGTPIPKSTYEWRDGHKPKKKKSDEQKNGEEKKADEADDLQDSGQRLHSDQMTTLRERGAMATLRISRRLSRKCQVWTMTLNLLAIASNATSNIILRLHLLPCSGGRL